MLNELRERGVKVDLGFPDEMWDTPDAEIVRLKTQVHKSSDEVLGGRGGSCTCAFNPLSGSTLPLMSIM